MKTGFHGDCSCPGRDRIDDEHSFVGRFDLVSCFGKRGSFAFSVFGKARRSSDEFSEILPAISGTLVANIFYKRTRMIPIPSYDLPDTPLLSIGDAAQLLGISINLLRLYEAEGLVLPARSGSNQRRYSRLDLERVMCIRHAIQNEKMTMSAIRRLMAMVPCWNIIGCSEKDRANCAAFYGTVQACWNYKHKDNTCATRVCRDCEVYRSSGDCSRIKELILNATKHSYRKEKRT